MTHELPIVVLQSHAHTRSPSQFLGLVATHGGLFLQRRLPSSLVSETPLADTDFIHKYQARHQRWRQLRERRPQS